MNEFLSKLAWVDVFVCLGVLRGGYVGFRSGFFTELLRILNYLFSIGAGYFFGSSLEHYLVLNTFLNSSSASTVSFFGVMAITFLIIKVLSMALLKISKAEGGNFISGLMGMVIGAFRWLILLSIFFMFISRVPVFNLKTDIEKSSSLGPSVSKIAPVLFDFISGSVGHDKNQAV